MAKKTVKKTITMSSTASPEIEMLINPKTLISHVAVDFNNEGLNNLGKKLNEVIDHLNSK
jgi:hypothetical protein